VYSTTALSLGMFSKTSMATPTKLKMLIPNAEAYAQNQRSDEDNALIPTAICAKRPSSCP